MRILLVEDETTLAAQLQAALTSVGYAVDVSHDGRDALYRGEVELIP